MTPKKRVEITLLPPRLVPLSAEQKEEAVRLLADLLLDAAHASVNRSWRRERTIMSLPVASARMLTPFADVSTPGKGVWAARWRCAAAAGSAFDGMQPTLTQVPPTVPRSTIATLAPSSVARIATENAAEPELGENDGRHISLS